MLKTSEGSPRASLLQKAVQQGQSAAHMSPLSFLRPPVHQQSTGNSPVMTMLAPTKTAVADKQKQSQLLTLIMHMLAAQKGNPA